MKHRIFIFLSLFFGLMTAANAQSASQILESASSQLQKGGIQASFVATSYKGLNPSGSANGSIYVQGNKFKVESDGMTTWFDGKTQWSMLSGSDEVNVTTPSAAEIQKMNPYLFINLYKNGYRSALKTVNYNGKKCNEVTLQATKKADINRMIIIFDSNNLPVNVRLKDAKGNWMRFRIGSLHTGKKFNDALFRFDKSKYPGIDIIDLR